MSTPMWPPPKPTTPQWKSTTATMATALLVPLTYWLDPISALAAIVTSTACAIFSGDIPSTLVRIPGTPASAAYTEDAYGFTRRGQPDRALGVALVSSVIGGLFGSIVLILLGPPVEVTDNQARMEQIARRYWPAIQGNATTAWVYYQGWAIYFAGQNVVDITQYLPPG